MKQKSTSYTVYMLECRDGSIYTGITNDLSKRLTQHAKGKGAKYTRGRLPIQLRYIEQVDTKSAALQREREIKKLPRSKKLSMIQEGRFVNENSKKL
ncbi:GIY-YIG nuclease family protein [Hazenella coriacea]|uniref:Putative endonuclease n=1 Tax=Hazenella coriacea TaxID=1179467 RepID=A0A4R3L3U0_9BACL|nr:GIY-YIG nuclease family protein [Hazenella coriacea]TCS94323.1 putative endonuclease [Hazenella coriacea]